MASAASRECSLLTSTAKNKLVLKQSMSLVPFWGGSADASGGNAHSSTKRSAKVDQAAGTLCSSLKYFERGIVGVCNTEDKQSIIDKLKSQSIEVVGVTVPPYSFDDSLAVRDRDIMVI
jgi:hypothetical protein